MPPQKHFARMRTGWRCSLLRTDWGAVGSHTDQLRSARSTTGHPASTGGGWETLHHPWCGTCLNLLVWIKLFTSTSTYLKGGGLHYERRKGSEVPFWSDWFDLTKWSWLQGNNFLEGDMKRSFLSFILSEGLGRADFITKAIKKVFHARRHGY